MIYCLCSCKDDQVIRTFDDPITAFINLGVSNDYYRYGTYLLFLDV